MVKNTVSQAWRLGKAVALAKKQANLGNLGSILVDSFGGLNTAQVLFSGKIIEVSRRIYKGHTIGEVIIQALAADEEDEDPDHPRQHFEGTMMSKWPSLAHSSRQSPSRTRTCMQSTGSTAKPR
jgi:hypothetical protein